jgi:hypothetical protein
MLRDGRILALFEDGSLVVMQSDGREEVRYPAKKTGPGFAAETIDGFRFFADNRSVTNNYKVHAADIIDNVLYFSDNTPGIKTQALEGF